MIELCEYCGKRPVKYKHGKRINKKAKYCSASHRVMAHRKTEKGKLTYIKSYKKRNARYVSKRRIWLWIFIEMLNIKETREYLNGSKRNR